MVGSEWREHDGLRYLYMGYGPDAATESVVTDGAMDLLRAEPDGALVRVLVDLSVAPLSGWSRDSMAKGRQHVAELGRRLDFRVAVLGARGPLAALMRGMSLVSSRYKAVPAPSLDKALEYLARG